MKKNSKETKDKEEGVGLERYLIRALDEIKQLKKKNVFLQEILEYLKGKKHKDHEEPQNSISFLKTQVEEAKKIEESLTIQLKDKTEIFQTREFDMLVNKIFWRLQLTQT